MAEICSSDCTLNWRGSDPKLSWLARVLDVLALIPPPVISALPLEMREDGAAAEMTLPSRTIANWFLGDWRRTRRWVTASKVFVPEELKRMDTAYWPRWLIPEDAWVSWVPSISAGPRMYLALVVGSQATSAFLGSVALPTEALSFLEQSSM